MMQNGFPAHLVLEVTSRCNLRCKGCAFHGAQAFVTRPMGHMSEEHWRTTIGEAGAWGHEVHLAVNGGGEPLLHPQLKDIVTFALTFPSLRVGFLTNGMLLDGDWAEFLVDCGMDWIAFSIDGISPDTHSLVRKSSDLRIVEKNLTELLKEKERAGVDKPAISLNMVAYDEVRDQTEAFIERWLSRVDHVMISHYRSPPSSKHWPGVPDERQPCSFLWSQMVIAWDGRLGLCCEDFNMDYSIGRVGDKPLLELWNGEGMSRVRKMHEQGRYRDHPMCRTCDTWADSMTRETRDEENRRTVLSRASQTVYTAM